MRAIAFRLPKFVKIETENNSISLVPMNWFLELHWVYINFRRRHIATFQYNNFVVLPSDEFPHKLDQLMLRQLPHKSVCNQDEHKIGWLDFVSGKYIWLDLNVKYSTVLLEKLLVALLVASLLALLVVLLALYPLYQFHFLQFRTKLVPNPVRTVHHHHKYYSLNSIAFHLDKICAQLCYSHIDNMRCNLTGP